MFISLAISFGSRTGTKNEHNSSHQGHAKQKLLHTFLKSLGQQIN